MMRKKEALFDLCRSTEERTIWRGVPQDLSHLYPANKEQVWWAFSSCTLSMKVLEAPSYLGKSGSRTLFSIETSGGRQIRSHSYFENEDEILLPPGMYLKVIDQMNPADGLHIIHLREIPPPMELLVRPFDLSQMPQKKTPKIVEKSALPPTLSVPKVTPAATASKGNISPISFSR